MIFIPGEVPSSKNSRVKTAHGVFASKAVNRYLRSFGIAAYSQREKVVTYQKRPAVNIFPFSELRWACAGISSPFCLGFHFVRRTKGRADFNNLTQILQDLFVAGGVIPDDDMTHIFPVPLPLFIGGTWRLCSVNKNNPGVFIDVGFKIVRANA